MRGLEHLSSVEGMEIRIVVAETVGYSFKDPGYCGLIHRMSEVRQRGKLCLQQLRSAGQQAGDKIEGHSDLLQYHRGV